MMTIFTALACLIIGILLRPKLMKFLDKQVVRTFSQDIHRFELEFQIQFYNQPTIHSVGADGKLTKLEPIKVNIEAKTEDEAIRLLADIVKEEIKTDLLSIKKVH